VARQSADPLLNLEEVGAELGVSKTTAWRYCVEVGLLPYINVGIKCTRLRVRLSAVEAFKTEREVRPIPRRARGRAA
jgi:predicted DNA-binding transcriptional regulator AlpA